jgi:chromosome transmission fidelity protein 4
MLSVLVNRVISNRILAYNNLGVVEVTDQDSHQIINVEFHDRSTYNSYHFTDYSRFTLASIGPRGIAYASLSEKSEPAKVTYKPYATWGSSSEWSISLAPGENVVSIAAGGIPTKRSYKGRGNDDGGDAEGAGNVVIATSSGYLRFFTGS